MLEVAPQWVRPSRLEGDLGVDTARLQACVGYIDLAHLGHTCLVTGRTQQLVLMRPRIPSDWEIGAFPINTYGQPLVIFARKHWVSSHDLLAT